MKKYNLSKIMTRAHEIRTAEYTNMNVALTRAWVEAKIENLEDIKTMLANQDGWKAAEYEENRQLTAQIAELKSRLPQVKIEPEYIPWTDKETAEIKAHMKEIVCTDWAEYRRLDLILCIGKKVA